MNDTMMNHGADHENAMSKGTERIVSLVPLIPPLPKRKRVAAYARVSLDKDAMLHSLAAQISYYKSLIQRKPDWEYAGVYAGVCDGMPEQRPRQYIRRRTVDGPMVVDQFADLARHVEHERGMGVIVGVR